MRLFKNTNIDFLKLKGVCISASIVAMVLSVISLVIKGGPNFGIDFTGGSQIVYQFSSSPNEDQIRKLLDGAGIVVSSVQRYDRPERNQVLLRVPQEKREGRDVSKEITSVLGRGLSPNATADSFDLNMSGLEALKANLVAADPEKTAQRPGTDPQVEYGRAAQSVIDARSRKGLFRSVDEAAATPGLSPAVSAFLKEKTIAGPFTLLSSEVVGPQVGKDLRQKGILAVVCSWAAMLLYIAWRFRSASFGAAAVVALIHDTWVTLGLCSILNTEISLTVVAAFLTLIGYSVNDTVVVYDRIRENLQKSKREPLSSVVNRSINQTLSRTTLTSVLTFLVVVALYFLGGETLNGFAFVMMAGIIVGTYSSIFIAAPLVIVWEEWKAARAGGDPRAPQKAAAAR